MNKRSLLPVLSTALLAPAFLAGQVYAEEATTPAESSAVVATPATSEAPAPVSNPVASATPTNEVETPATVASAEAPSAPAESTKSDEKDTVILHTNDVHGRIVEEKGVIGDAKLATVIEQERAKSNQNTLVVDAGDAFQGLPISNSTKGEARAEILNQMQYDAMAVGNHEFDFGLDEVKKYKEILKFPLLSSNTYVNGARLFEASTIVDKDKTVEGDEFVVIGVTTPETATKTHPKNIKGVTFTDPISEVNKVIEEVQAKVRAEGKDYKHYVVLAHLGVDTTTPVEWRGSTLAEALSKNPRLKGKRVTVIDGHSHTVASTTYGDNVTYNQTGSYLHNVGKVIYKSRQLLGNPTLIAAGDAKKLPANPTVEKLVKDIKQKYDAENAVEIVSNSPVELNGDRENVRVRETNLGNVVADSLYQYGQTGFSHPTDIAVTNGGGLRETIAKGKPITKGNVIAVLPFGNTISQIQVTGQQVLDMFEKSLGSILQVDKDGKKVLDENGQPLLEPSGGFLQVSGVKVYYDTNLPSGKRVLAIQVKNRTTGRYDLLDLAKTYYLATNDFLAAGGDGYTMLGGAREEGPSMDAAFEEYLKTADLTQYEKINPNSRTISVDSKNFSLPVETPQTNAAASDATTNVPLTYEVAGQFSKKAVVSEKALPNTGSEQSIFLLLMGMVAGLAGILSSRKPKLK
ncbi:cell surface ecto-5'-nucleotidase Nt5e [Streptococcus oralis]|uniref:cell surface ecto-5'-nucleotidase Nt5e n=1 Tax=Streptococcus oralis TaxID=1303 RepID=UPI000A0FC354|nr:cell surface ecto-5'-nucleotidase Nt5e [Streptococcus oralis]MBZ2084091.1 5'-nucleotidase C-terminal domain-containing protein [Streptococcus oralis]ORO35071.1 bifunctional metallophosphatase/5'-nucleotidase [Streptococcus oralis subsp. tigurinus]